MKSDEMPYIIYANIEFLIKKIDECAKNPEIFSTTKIGENFDHIEDKHTLYCGKDCMKKVCTFSRDHAKI